MSLNPSILSIEILSDKFDDLMTIMSSRGIPIGDPDFILDRTMPEEKLKMITELTGHRHEHKSDETTREFLENPIIHGYLTRPVSQIEFVDLHPRLTDSGQSIFHRAARYFSTEPKHENTDHYELKVYKYLSKIICYRDSMIATSRFYTVGTSCITVKSLNQMLQALTQDSTDISVVDFKKDFYHIKDYILTRQFMHINPDELASRFLLFSNTKDDHASTILSVMDPITNRALVTILLNSWINPTVDYYTYLKDRFLKTTVYSERADLISNEKLSQQVLELFSIDINDLSAYPKSIILEATNVESNPLRTKSICLIDYEDNVHCFRYSEIYRHAIKMLDIDNIDRLYIISKNQSDATSTNLVDVVYKPTESFIDASHQLQIANINDQNCALYSYNFIKAIIALLKESVHAEEVFQLARALNNKDKNAEARLQHIFREELKTYLPQYYTESGQPKSSQELTQMHLELRWNIGSKSLSMFNSQKLEIATDTYKQASLN